MANNKLNSCKECGDYIDYNKAIKCKGNCNQWFDLDCSNITDQEFKTLIEPGSNVLWFCEYCKKIMSYNTTLLNDSIIEMKTIKDLLVNIQYNVQKNNQSINKLMKQLSNEDN